MNLNSSRQCAVDYKQSEASLRALQNARRYERIASLPTIESARSMHYLRRQSDTAL